MQRRRSCQNSCSIHVYVVPTAVCTPVLYTLILTVQLSFLSDRLEHRIHPGDTTQTPKTQSQMMSSGSPTKKWRNHSTYLFAIMASLMPHFDQLQCHSSKLWINSELSILTVQVRTCDTSKIIIALWNFFTNNLCIIGTRLITQTIIRTSAYCLI